MFIEEASVAEIGHRFRRPQQRKLQDFAFVRQQTSVTVLSIPGDGTPKMSLGQTFSTGVSKMVGRPRTSKIRLEIKRLAELRDDRRQIGSLFGDCRESVSRPGFAVDNEDLFCPALLLQFVKPPLKVRSIGVS